MFIFGCISCSIGFIFFYGNTLQIKRFESGGGNTYSFRLYSMSFDKPISLEDVKSKQLLKSEMIEDIQVCHMISGNEDAGIPDDYYKLCARLYNKDKIIARQGRTDFTESDLKDNNQVIILPLTHDFGSVKIGNNIKIEKNQYSVIGISGFFDTFFITPKAFLQGDYTIDSITVILKKQPIKSQAGKFMEDLSKSFPNGYITESPNDYFNEAESRATSDFLLVSIMFVISLLSFMFLMKFLIDKNNLESVIYTVVGATRKQVIFTLLLEIVSISAFSAIIACILHHIFYNDFFDYINIYSGIKYYLSDYIIISSAIIVCSCLTALPFIISSIRNSIIENKNKYNE